MKAFSWKEAPHGAIVADGKRLEAAAFGPPPGTAPTLVLLHEGLGCVALWRDFPERLAEATGFGVFAYSRAGYGRSDPVDLPRPLDYMAREARISLPAVLGALGFRQGVLVGHSDGASIAAIYAGEHQDERVRGLVLMAPHLFAEAPGLASIAEAKTAYETGGLREKLARYHAHVDSAFLGWNGAWLDPGFEAWNIEEFIDRWRVPSLLIQGADDQYGTIAQIRAIERRSPRPVKTLILEGCRHAPHLEQPEPTLEAVAAFCKRVLGGVP
jgi:pimeloyl-ACP methyl ester carboxylesterase